MIISDLSHFEEVVAEAPNIVGGETTTKLEKVPDADMIKALKDAGLSDLLGTQVTVNSVSVKTPGGTSSAETAVGKTKEGEQVKVSESNSSATATK